MKSPNRCRPYTVTSFSNNVSSIYRRSHDLIIGGSIATINSTRSFPPFHPVPLSFLFSPPRFRYAPETSLKEFLSKWKKRRSTDEEQGSYRVCNGCSKQRRGDFCGWLCGINEKSRWWSKDKDLNFLFFFCFVRWKVVSMKFDKKKNNMEEKECDEFLDFIIIESTQSLNF